MHENGSITITTYQMPQINKLVHIHSVQATQVHYLTFFLILINVRTFVKHVRVFCKTLSTRALN